MKTNEGSLDRLLRFLIAVLAVVVGYFWLTGTVQIIAYVVAIAALFTSVVGFCSLYPLLKIQTCETKPMNKKIMVLGIVSIVLLGAILSFASAFFSRKFFLEDFAHMNDSYKQLLFNSGKEKRSESISYYEKLIPAYALFQKKYTDYKPYALKGDDTLDADLEKIARLLNDIKDGVYTGDLSITHKRLEEIRTIEQEMFKRNGFSMLAVALVDFHDIMELVIAGADSRDTQKIIDTYPLADEKLRAIELELNDERIQAIRKNLDAILDMAKANKLDLLEQQGADLKASFVKVYLIKG